VPLALPQNQKAVLPTRRVPNVHWRRGNAIGVNLTVPVMRLAVRMGALRGWTAIRMNGVDGRSPRNLSK